MIIPDNRLEQILAGEKLEPQNRLEYFLQEALKGNALPVEINITDNVVELEGVSLKQISDAYAEHRACYIDYNNHRLYLVHCDYSADDNCTIEFNSSFTYSGVGADTKIISVVFSDSDEGALTEKVVNLA